MPTFNLNPPVRVLDESKPLHVIPKNQCTKMIHDTGINVACEGPVFHTHVHHSPPLDQKGHPRVTAVAHTQAEH